MKLNIFSFETLFKRIFRYLLKRYFGQYILDFSQDELSYGFSHGKGSIENVQLNVEALNELSEEYNLPFEFQRGAIDFISILVPWTSLLNENTIIDVKGLKLVVQPKSRADDVSVFDSMWSTTSSLQLAEECLNANEDEEELEVPDGSEGLKKIAKTIDTVLANMKIRFHDSSIKIEHVLPDGFHGISLEMKVAIAEYFDEAGISVISEDFNDKGSYEPSAYSVKRIVFEGISLYTAEFIPKKKISTFQPLSSNGMNTFIPGSPELPPPHTSLPMFRSEIKVECNPVLISKLSGQQEVRLKLKQDEALIGPKVDVEFSFGALNFFLTPQQVHSLCTLIYGLIKPDSSNDVGKKDLSVTNKPMRPSDYMMVEQELLRQQERREIGSKSLKKNQGWSSHSLDESDEYFHLMPMERKPQSEYPISTSSLDGSFTSSVNSDVKSETSCSSFSQKMRKGPNMQAILSDPLSELTHFHGCLSSLLVIILHDDSVQESQRGNLCTDTKSESSKVHSLSQQADQFFSDLISLQMAGINFQDFPSLLESLSKFCKCNHLQLMASNISLDGSEKQSSVECIVKFTLSMHQFQVFEFMFKPRSEDRDVTIPKYVKILSVSTNEEPDNNAKSEEACFKMNYSQIGCMSQNRNSRPPANKLDIECGKIFCDFDISLTDRIHTLLSFNPVPEQLPNLFDTKDSEVGTITRTSAKTEIKVCIPNVIINVRFPIVDMRSTHNMDRSPWWQQNVHDEILVLDIVDFSLFTVLDSNELHSKYELQARDVHGLLKLFENEDGISFLRVSVDPDTDEVSQEKGFDWPRLVIRKMNQINSPNLEPHIEETEDLASFSITYDLMNNFSNDFSPFCTTAVVHDRKKMEQGNVHNSPSESDEVIKPIDKDSLINFIEQTVNKSECMFQFTLPTLNIYFQNKDFFELLYNRICNDLLLWENASLAPTRVYDPSDFKVHVPGLLMASSFQKESPHFTFPLFKAFGSDSNPDSEEENEEFLSLHDYHQRHKQKHKKYTDSSLTKISVSFAVSKGQLLVNSSLSNENEEMVDSYGKLQLSLEESLFLIASSYKGDPNESYMCLLSETSSLYHEGCVSVKNNGYIVQPLSSRTKQNMKRIIYKSPPGSCLKMGNTDDKDMLKVVTHIAKSSKQQLKTVKVAFEIASATLRHYVVPSSQIWINQLMDFFKVSDFPISGYTAPAVVTEMHLALSDCVIDYRPLHLAYRTAFTIENFNMSCNVSAASTFLFRLISEELRFFISNNIHSRVINLKKDYVCIIDSGLIDISIRTNSEEKGQSTLNMCITNNTIHLRTCADSFRALLELIQYLNMNGDCDEVDLDQKPSEKANAPIGKNKASECNTNKLDSLFMAEAFKECDYGVNSDKKGHISSSRISPQYDYTSTDEEFCILEDDPGVGLLPQNGEPCVRVLSNTPIQIVENHFAVPAGKSDVLKAPKNFPNPVILLRLEEMSAVWHLYGGSDFDKLEQDMHGNSMDALKMKHSVTFSGVKNFNGGGSECISFCNVTPVNKHHDDISIVHFSMEHITLNHEESVNNLDLWLQRGGPNRNHDVLMEFQMNKIQFQREVYPDDGEYASRYVLLIQDIEIRDRLAASQINKFLYQYSTKDLPRQSHANMIEVKAVYIRPDQKRSTEECSLKISCKPLRLNVDQDSLMFLVDFFQQLLNVPGNSEEPDGTTEEGTSPLAECCNFTPSSTDSEETFYRYFSFSPDVLIRIDYHGKRVQMEQGALKGILLGLGQLNASEIKLKRLSYKYGLLGHQRLFMYAFNEWQNDILKNQLPSLLGGVGCMHSFVQLFQGIKDLFYLPVMQYQKDGQIVRGLQKGASSFSTSSVVAALDLLSRFLSTLKGTAEVGYDMVNPGPRLPGKYKGSQELYRKNSQPADFIEGVTAAYNIVKEGLEDTARTIYRVASTEHEHKGVPGAVGGVLRQIPPSLFKPIILGSEATGYVLDGVRHQLMPDAHQEDIHKWRTQNNG